VVEHKNGHELAIRRRCVQAKNAVVSGVVTGGDLLHFDTDALFCWDGVVEHTGRRCGGRVAKSNHVCIEVMQGADVFRVDTVHFFWEIDAERGARLEILNRKPVQRVHLFIQYQICRCEHYLLDEDVGTVRDKQVPVLLLRQMLKRRDENLKVCGAVLVGVDVELRAAVVDAEKNATAVGGGGGGAREAGGAQLMKWLEAVRCARMDKPGGLGDCCRIQQVTVPNVTSNTFFFGGKGRDRTVQTSRDLRQL
jgi:hypothetical protein